jgi:8-oxo-dGTP diphosphatase
MSLPNCPHLTVDAVVRWRGCIIIIDRLNPPLGFALPGGFVDVGESCEDAVRRELKEETNLDGHIASLVGVYSKPDRDKRGHIVSVAYAMEAEGNLKAKDDAKEVHAIEIADALAMDFICDHRQILLDAMNHVFNRRGW